MQVMQKKQKKIENLKYDLKIDPKLLKRYRKKVDKSQQIIVDKKILSLEENPQRGHKLFSIYPDLYELYAGSYRIYYVVQEKEVTVVIIAYEHKKVQEKLLNSIKKDNSIIDNILKEIV